MPKRIAPDRARGPRRSRTSRRSQRLAVLGQPRPRSPRPPGPAGNTRPRCAGLNREGQPCGRRLKQGHTRCHKHPEPVEPVWDGDWSLRKARWFVVEHEHSNDLKVCRFERPVEQAGAANMEQGVRNVYEEALRYLRFHDPRWVEHFEAGTLFDQPLEVQHAGDPVTITKLQQNERYVDPAWVWFGPKLIRSPYPLRLKSEQPEEGAES
jgi:hypothetical protein